MNGIRRSGSTSGSAVAGEGKMAAGGGPARGGTHSRRLPGRKNRLHVLGFLIGRRATHATTNRRGEHHRRRGRRKYNFID